MTRKLDRALFLAGETTLTAGEVAVWAGELGYPVRESPDVEPVEQLRVALAEDALGWRDESHRGRR